MGGGGGGQIGCYQAGGGWGRVMLFCIPGVTHHLDHGDTSPRLYPHSTCPLLSHAHPKGVLGPSHLSPIIGVTPGDQHIHRTAGKVINYSTTFINTGIFTVHSLLVAVTMEIGEWGGQVGKRGITTKKKEETKIKIREGMKERERNLAEE